MTIERIPPYRIVAVREDGSRFILSNGYAARGWVFASATKWAIGCKCDGNPRGLRQLELEDSEGKPLNEYNSSPMLQIEGV